MERIGQRLYKVPKGWLFFLCFQAFFKLERRGWRVRRVHCTALPSAGRGNRGPDHARKPVFPLLSYGARETTAQEGSLDEGEEEIMEDNLETLQRSSREGGLGTRKTWT